MQKTKKINYIRKYRKILSLSIIVLLVIFTTAVPGVRGNTNEPEDTEGSAKVIGVSNIIYFFSFLHFPFPLYSTEEYK